MFGHKGPAFIRFPLLSAFIPQDFCLHLVGGIDAKQARTPTFFTENTRVFVSAAELLHVCFILDVSTPLVSLSEQ